MIESVSMSSYLLEEIRYNLVSGLDHLRKKKTPRFDQELLEAFK